MTPSTIPTPETDDLNHEALGNINLGECPFTAVKMKI